MRGGIAIACLLALPAPLFAQESDRHTTLARELFEEGNTLMRDGEHARAAERFERALTLRPTEYIRYNLAAALVELGQLVHATELLRAIDRDPIATREVRIAARLRLADLEPRLARIVVRVSGDLGRARLYLDDRQLDPLAGEVLVDPGRHSIVVRDGSEVLFSRELDAAEGSRHETAVELESRAPDAALEMGPEAEGGSIFEEWWFWTIGAALLAGGATAIVLLTLPDSRDPYAASLGTIPIP